MSDYNWDTLGVTRRKDSPRLFDVRLTDFQAAVDWLKRFIACYGYIVLDVELDAYSGVWLFHVEDTAIRVEHMIVGRLQHTLAEIRMWEIAEAYERNTKQG